VIRIECRILSKGRKERRFCRSLFRCAVLLLPRPRPPVSPSVFTFFPPALEGGPSSSVLAAVFGGYIIGGYRFFRILPRLPSAPEITASRDLRSPLFPLRDDRL